MSQEVLAKKIGTSQSHIAKIEAGDENFTQATATKMVRALDGRFNVSVAPAEYPQSWPRPWFDAMAPKPAAQFGPWSLNKVERRDTVDTQEFRFTIGRKFRRDTLPKADLLLVEAKAS